MSGHASLFFSIGVMAIYHENMPFKIFIKYFSVKQNLNRIQADICGEFEIDEKNNFVSLRNVFFCFCKSAN